MNRNEMLAKADKLAWQAENQLSGDKAIAVSHLANYWLERALSLRWIREEERRELIQSVRKEAKS